MRRPALALSTGLLALALGVTALRAADPHDSATEAAELSSARGVEIAASTPGDFTGLGFDQCVAPTQAAMDAWVTASPYRAVGIYISGDSRACRVQPNLSPIWISTWSRAAGDCCRSPWARRRRASTASRATPTTSRSTRHPAGSDASWRAQGVVEADKNVTDATALGIGPGATLWYDLEAFDLGGTPTAASRRSPSSAPG